MSRHVHPLGLHKGDVVSPLFNPRLLVVVDHVALSALGTALPRHNPDLPSSTKVRLVLGTHRDGNPARLLLDTKANVRLVMRDGKEVNP